MPNMEINVKLFDQLPPSAVVIYQPKKLHIYHYFLPSGKQWAVRSSLSFCVSLSELHNCRCINTYGMQAYHKSMHTHAQEMGLVPKMNTFPMLINREWQMTRKVSVNVVHVHYSYELIFSLIIGLLPMFYPMTRDLGEYPLKVIFSRLSKDGGTSMIPDKKLFFWYTDYNIIPVILI